MEHIMAISLKDYKQTKYPNLYKRLEASLKEIEQSIEALESEQIEMI